MNSFSVVKRVAPDIVVAALSVPIAMYLRLGREFFNFDTSLVLVIGLVAVGGEILR